MISNQSDTVSWTTGKWHITAGCPVTLLSTDLYSEINPAVLMRILEQKNDHSAQRGQITARKIGHRTRKKSVERFKGKIAKMCVCVWKAKREGVSVSYCSHTVNLFVWLSLNNIYVILVIVLGAGLLILSGTISWPLTAAKFPAESQSKTSSSKPF